MGLIKIQPGTNPSEEGFDCDAHLSRAGADEPQPALEVGSPDKPIPAQFTARIRLVYIEALESRLVAYAVPDAITVLKREASVPTSNLH